MNTSTTVGKLALALADAHRAMPTLTKDGVNPHFKSRYLTLDGLLGAVRGPLLANGILLIQSANDSDDAGLSVVTRLQHTSGEFIEGTVRMPLEKPTPQAAGSALSYGRRYGLEAILGLTGSEDDDGNSATVHQALQPVKRNAEGVLVKPDTLGGRHTTVTDGVTTTTPPCPLCGGSMWSNLEKKASGQFKPSSPDYRCRDKACKGVIWPDKNAKQPAAVPVGPAFDDVPEGLREEFDLDQNAPY